MSLEDKRTNLFHRILFMNLEDKRTNLFQLILFMSYDVIPKIILSSPEIIYSSPEIMKFLPKKGANSVPTILLAFCTRETLPIGILRSVAVSMARCLGVGLPTIWGRDACWEI